MGSLLSIAALQPVTPKQAATCVHAMHLRDLLGSTVAPEHDPVHRAKWKAGPNLGDQLGLDGYDPGSTTVTIAVFDRPIQLPKSDDPTLYHMAINIMYTGGPDENPPIWLELTKILGPIESVWLDV